MKGGEGQVGSLGLDERLPADVNRNSRYAVAGALNEGFIVRQEGSGHLLLLAQHLARQARPQRLPI